MRTLQAVVDRIIPPDEYPGGWGAGVGDYLLRQLQGDLRGEVEHYRQGLDAIEAEALARQSSFAALDAHAQDALLSSIERGDVRTQWPLNPALFFTMLVEHCMEGFYSDPGNGGNRDEIAWRMIGFEVRDEV